MRPRLLAGATVAAHVSTVVLANVLTAHLGMVPVWFGLVATAGTYAAGAGLLMRDIVHRVGGTRLALLSIGLGGAVSWFASTPRLALASTVAFLIAEMADLAVYAPLRRRGFILAAALSNIVSAPIDTIAFLALAGFGTTAPIIAGQLVGKLLWATALPLLIVSGVRRAVSR